MGKSYTKEYEINYYDVDKNLKVGMPRIIDILCDAGTRQSEELGADIDTLVKNNMAWVFYHYDVKIFRNPVYGEKIKATTEAVGFKKFYALRNYEMRDANGNIIAEAKAIFLLINLEKRRMMRVPEDQYEIYGAGEISENFNPPKLEKLLEHKYEEVFKVRYSDIDSNQHVNNTKYIDWALESIPEEIIDNYRLEEIKVTFQKECKYGEKIKVLTDIREEEDRIVTLHKIESLDGKELTILIGKWKAK